MNAALLSKRTSSALFASTSTRSVTMLTLLPIAEMRLVSHRTRRACSSRFLCRAEEENKVRALWCDRITDRKGRKLGSRGERFLVFNLTLFSFTSTSSPLLQIEQPPPPPASPQRQQQPPSRRSSVLGDIVETTGATPLPEPESDDFFQGDGWEWLGSAAAVAVPALVLAAVAVGAFAAKTYDSGADSVLLPSSAEDRPAVMVPVEEFDRKVAEMSR